MFSINCSTLVVPGGGGLSDSDFFLPSSYLGLVNSIATGFLGPSGNLGTGARGSFGLLEPANPFCFSVLTDLGFE